MEHGKAGWAAQCRPSGIVAFVMAAAISLFGTCWGQAPAYADLVAAQDDAAQAYAVLDDASDSITLYYGPLADSGQHGGRVFVLDEGGSFVPQAGNASWSEAQSQAASVRIDESMSAFQPQSTASWFAGMAHATSYEGLGNLNLGNCTSTRAMFSNNSALASIDVSGWDMSHVTDMGSMFEGCSALRHINGLGTWTACKPETIGYMFAHCGQLDSQSLSGLGAWDVSQLQSASYMFANEPELDENPESGIGTAGLSIDLSSWHTNSHADLTSMFSGCTNLVELKLGSASAPVKASGTSHMFSLCFALETLDLHGLDTSSVQDMSYMFLACTVASPNTGIEDFDVSSVTNFSSMFQGSVLYTEDKDSKYGQLLDLSAWDVGAGSKFGNMFTETRTSLDLTGWEFGKSADITDIFYDTGIEHIYYMPGSGMTGLANKGAFAAGNNMELVGENGKVRFKNYDSESQVYASSSYLRVPELDVDGVLSVFSDAGAIKYDLTTERGKSIATPPEDCGISGASVVLSSPVVAGKSVRWNTKEDGTGRSFEPGSTIYRPVRGLRLYAQWYDSPTVSYATLDQAGTLTLRHGNDFNGFPSSTSVLGANDQSFVSSASLDENAIPWNDVRRQVKAVVIDKSFASAKPKSLAHWFSGLTACTSIDGLENLDVSQVESAESAFANSAQLETLDLSSWDVAKLGTTRSMFEGCSKLSCIVAQGEGWQVAGDAEHMFAGCESLAGYDSSRAVALGANPFAYRSSHDDASLARMPEGATGGGYFSSKAWSARKLTVEPVPSPQSNMPATGTYVVPKGASIALADPTLDGATFAGWAAGGAEAGSIAWTESGQTRSFAMPDGDVSLAPQFTCTIKFESADEAGGIAWNGETEQTVAYGATATPPKPTRSGQMFAGWFADKDCSTPWDEDTPITRHGTAYAKWAEAGDLMVTLSAYSATYTGEKQAPEVTVTNGDGSALPAATYSLSWTFNGQPSDETDAAHLVNAGTYVVQATETGGAASARTASATFVIGKADIHPTVSITSWTYGDTANAPRIEGAGEAEVSYAYRPSDSADSSAALSAEAPTDAGSYTVQATIGETPNYKGAIVTADFAIAPLDLRDERIAVSKRQATFAGAEQTPPISITFNGAALGEGDYKFVSFKHSAQAADEPADVQAVIDAGNYTTTIAGRGNFSGTLENVGFTVDPAVIGNGAAPLDGFEVVVPDSPYAGEGQLPNPSITWKKDGGLPIELRIGTDFQVTDGSDNKGVGEGKATVVGSGNYAGNFPVSFQIVPASLASSAVSVSVDPNYGASSERFPLQIEPKVSYATSRGTLTLTPDEDYDVSFLKEGGEQTKAAHEIDSYGLWQVVVTGKGNFKGEAKATTRVSEPQGTLMLKSGIEGVSLGNEAEQRISVGQRVVLKDPTLASATFDHWEIANAGDLAEELTIEYSQGEASFTMPETDLELAPQFVHKVTFMSADPAKSGSERYSITNWGNGATGISLTVKVPYGQTLADLAESGTPLPAPTIGKKIFGGWFTDAQFTSPLDDKAPLGASTEVYARWDGEDPDLDPSPGDDPDPGDDPNTDPGTDPDPGDDPNPDPGTDPDPGNDPGDDPNPDPGADPEDNPDPGADPDPDPGSDPNADPDPDPSPDLNPSQGDKSNPDGKDAGASSDASGGNAGGSLDSGKGQDASTAKVAVTATSIKKLVPAKRSFTVKWKKRAGKVSGYQIRYSTKKNMKDAKKKTVKKAATAKLKIKKLKSKKRYYVQIRTFKKVNGTTYFSSWSKKKSVKTK